MPSLQLVPYPMMDGTELSFASIEANFGGRTFAGFVSVDYSDSLKPGIVRGASPRKLARTAGDEDFTLSATMRKSEFENYRALLSGGQGYMRVSHPITFTYFEIGANAPIVDVALGCRITEAKDSHKQGVEGLVVAITYDVMRILRSGTDNPVLPVPIP
jgi:hypothetical protein